MSQTPNIILIMADQLRYDFVKPFMPNVQQLISDSTHFTNAYCVSPLCVPSRGAFFTGTYPTTNGCLINPWEKEDESYGRLNKDFKTFYETFENDWDVWHTGKQHLLCQEELMSRPKNKTNWRQLEGRYKEFLNNNDKEMPGGKAYRHFCPEIKNGNTTKIRGYSIPTTGLYSEELDYFYDGFILKDSLEAIQSRNTSKPFALSAMFLAPHPPLQIPEPYYSMYKDVPLPENVGRWYEGQSPLQLYQLTGFFGSRYSRKQWEEIWRVYAGLVTLLDDCIGKIILELKKQDLYDNSLILFTSDHGEMLGSHGLWQKMCMYEESLRVPLSIKFPGNKNKGKEINQSVSHLDVMPTLHSAMGLKGLDQFQGKSLERYLDTKKEAEPVFAQFDGNGALGTFQRCVIKDGFKFMIDKIHEEFYFEFYDLNVDPQETDNLIMDKNKNRNEYVEILMIHLKDKNDPIQFNWSDLKDFESRHNDLKGHVYHEF